MAAGCTCIAWLALAAVATNARAQDKPDLLLRNADAAPWIAVVDYTELGIKLTAGVWTTLDDYFPARADLLHAIKPRLEEAGCTFAGVPDRRHLRNFRANGLWRRPLIATSQEWRGSLDHPARDTRGR